MPRFDHAFLEELVKRDGATITKADDALCMSSHIEFVCKCGTADTKRFGSFIYPSPNGVHCRACVKKIGIEKKKQTNLERFGVEHVGHKEEFRKKQQETMLAKYGVTNPMKSSLIKQKAIATNLKKYGVASPSQLKEIQEKQKETMRKLYGVDNIFSHKETQDKIKYTNLERYGVSNPMQSALIQEKLEATSQERYGTRRPTENILIKQKLQNTYKAKTEEERKAIIEKAKETNLEKYGVESSNQADIVKKHKREANRKKYGVDNPMQNIEVRAALENRGFQHKEFTMPSGAIRKVQGYEPFALRDLLTAYTEDQIVTARTCVPRISYQAQDGIHTRYYFPDIYLPHENRLIEVKSTWTYGCNTDNIQRKGDACRAAGYAFEIWVYDIKGKRVHPEI